MLRWATRRVVQTTLALVGLAVFAVLALTTDLDRAMGTATLGVICAAVGIALYFPLSWAAVRWVERRHARLG
ncbi:Hypothetical protein A7982_06111 [Minicystis rosea]|nr:Hypothetical protein A7982_06111 [Minicystis rosea]